MVDDNDNEDGVKEAKGKESARARNKEKRNAPHTFHMFFL